jgi:hypothetical protein
VAGDPMTVPLWLLRRRSVPVSAISAGHRWRDRPADGLGQVGAHLRARSMRSEKPEVGCGTTL